MLQAFALILEVLFGIGVVGSMVVVIVTFIEDLRELGPDEEHPVQAESQSAALRAISSQTSTR
jgi:hypothetical protein